jgi:hypothetical protein
MFHNTFLDEDFIAQPFYTWVREAIRGEVVSTRVKHLAEGCLHQAHVYQRMWAYGKYLRTTSSETFKRNCNSGIVRKRNAGEDGNDIGNVDEPGILEEILLLDYGMFEFTVLKVKWFDATLGTTLRKEVNGFTLIDSREFATHGRRQREISKFCLPNEVEQVFFSPDRSDANWWVVMPHREQRTPPNM